MDNKKDFSKRKPFWDIPIPDLLALQRDSFFDFIQLDSPPNRRMLKGLEKVFREAFPVEDVHHKFVLDFVEYGFGESRYTPEEALSRGANYTVPLKATFRLIRKEQDRSERSRIKDVVEEEVYLCELPFMTPQGTFIINGVERVVIGQLHRSPGLYYSRDGDEYSVLLVPARGAWFEVVVDRNRSCWVILDRRRRIPLFTFLQALGYSPDEVFAQLFRLETGPLEPSRSLGQAVFVDHIRYAQAGEVITPELKDFLAKKGVEEVVLIAKDEPGVEVVTRSLADDKAPSQEEALRQIFVRLRSMPPQSLEVARNTILNLLFDPQRFDLGRPGRFKLNKRLGLTVPLDEPAFTPEDLFRMLRQLLEFVAHRLPADDLEHLGNRRVKRVGELLENQFRIALLQVAQGVRERAAFVEAEATPQELINARLVQNTVMKFFTSNQLCQFLDQINPLSELTHKRRVSALGPGGLTRETAGFEVRDIHYSHYGRLCPIETPEGPNIGLITTVTTYAREDEFGFLATPYLRVRSGRVSKELVYLNAEEEERYTIAQANAPLDSKGRFLNPSVLCRRGGEVVEVAPEQVDFMDVSPKQVLAPSTCLIPFLEHDDADRALMGTNMQRQAVPLLRPEPPLVATGVEARFARESGAVVLADEPGQVLNVDASHILLRTRSGLLKDYRLKKFVRSNQYTCIHQCPRVREGQEVKEGDLLADGPATSQGELALGRNLLIAYMPLRGYNYEDAIVISESLLANDAFTSIQILAFEIQARETKLGPEEITRDIPGATEEELAELDEFGIIRVGAEVKPGDLLVGRITPKGEIELTPEERLLWAIFGEKAHNVKDSSLRVEPGVYGLVISRQVLTRRTQDPLARSVEQERLKDLESRVEMERQLVLERRDLGLKELLLGQTAARGVYDRKGHRLLKKGKVFDVDFFAKGKLARVNRFDSLLEDEERQKRIDEVVYEASRALFELEESRRKKEILKIHQGDELPHGVLKWIKVYIAQRRKLSVGDKMSGRHGNKGVVAKILPREDMPYLTDGTPVDMVVNPLGVPSRMNIGQILEVHLGWAARRAGYQAVCPVFEGATPDEVREELRAAGLPEDGEVLLYDGRTGLPFDEKVVVGELYMMKLIHMVDDKLHARSTGRYSLITQQPLGGKAQFGGQRFGEMEVWALEGYGAAHTLQEMLTVKSDDVEGRAELYDALVKGKNPPPPRVPASFSVLTKELQGLGLELVPEKEQR